MPKQILTFSRILAAEHARIEEIAAREAANRPIVIPSTETRPIGRIAPAGREFFLKQFQMLLEWIHAILAPFRKERPLTFLADGSKVLAEDEGRRQEAFNMAHRKPHAALCLSGGGIRSATFNLGLLQGFARRGLVKKFHYLSTVSGGGFIGSWFSAWTYRTLKGDGSAVADIQSLHSPSKTEGSPDPAPVSHLRRFSNYLSPKLGLFGADTWTLVSIYIRNVLLNGFVLVPFLAAVLMAPRVIYSLMNSDPAGMRLLFLGPDFLITILLILGVAGGVTGIAFVGLNLPSIRIKNNDERAYIKYCLIPLLTSATALSTLWRWFVRNTTGPQTGWLPSFSIVKTALDNSAIALVLTLALILIPWGICATYVRVKNKPVPITSSLFCTLLLAGAGYVTAFLLHLVAETAATADPRIYTTFSVPFMLAAMMVGGTLISGITSRLTSDQDDEWWARSGAWLQISLAAWAGLCGIVLWAPALILGLLAALIENPQAAFSSWTNTFSAVAGVAGAASTVLSLIGGWSASTAAQPGHPSKSFMGVNAAALTNVLAGIAVIFVFATLAAATGPVISFGAATDLFNHAAILEETTLFKAVAVTVGLLVFGYIAGVLVDTNKFSLHYYWRNRIVRAYLGASRNPQSGASDLSVAFTGFDSDDNIRMSELADQLPLHVVNIALNLSGGKQLQWQERKADSFTVSPLHCGNHRIGYRRSTEYGGPNGISLGTAVAMSGAAASPNMGYMMTSSAVRFLMTLFNVRLGWWLGNPGPTGNLTYEQRSPRHIVRPLMEEALGLTDEEAPYVYLSDGGHFDNLGLYEMVLRRCHWIVVSDASTDPDYSYESLAVSLRKIRIDLGIGIDFDAPLRMGRFEDNSGVYCATGTIRYSDIDSGAPDGRILYIKPSLTGSEPADIRNYVRCNPAFPQEPISDQYFSESQFESYRALGEHIAEMLSRGNAGSLDELINGSKGPKDKPTTSTAVAGQSV